MIRTAAIVSMLVAGPTFAGDSVSLAGRYLAWTGDDVVVHDLVTGTDVFRLSARDRLDEVAVQPDGTAAFSYGLEGTGSRGRRRARPGRWCSTPPSASTICGRRAAACCTSAGPA